MEKLIDAERHRKVKLIVSEDSISIIGMERGPDAEYRVDGQSVTVSRSVFSEIVQAIADNG